MCKVQFVSRNNIAISWYYLCTVTGTHILILFNNHSISEEYKNDKQLGDVNFKLDSLGLAQPTSASSTMKSMSSMTSLNARSSEAFNSETDADINRSDIAMGHHGMTPIAARESVVRYQMPDKVYIP